MRIASALIALGSLVAAVPATASDNGPTAEESAAYIAAKLEQCRPSEPRAPDGTQIRTEARAAIRGPTVSIVHTTRLFNPSNKYEKSLTLALNHQFDIRDIREVRLIKLLADDDGRVRELSELHFSCREDQACIRIVGKEGLAEIEGREVRFELPVCNADTGERLGRAFRHLMKVTGKVKELF